VAFVAVVWLPIIRIKEADRAGTVRLLCRWMWVLVCLLLVAGLVELPLYAVRASGEAFSSGLLGEALFDTRVGHLWIERVALGVLTATVATYAAQRPWRPAYWWAMTVVGGALLLLTLTQQSHAAAEGSFLPFAADWLHVIAASLWMGGLLGFPILLLGPLRTMPTEARSKLLGRVVPRFSNVATIAVMTLIVTGLYAILLHVPSFSALATPYGNALVVKLEILVVLLIAGALNLVGRGQGAFAQMVSFELLLAILILAVTGLLTTLPPADAAQEAASNVAVRVSGTPGTPYSGTYGTSDKTRIANNILRTGFTEYEVAIEDGVSGEVSAAFRKTQPGEGLLRVEIVADDAVVAGRETSEELGTVDVSWPRKSGG
jgi:copper transport protein